MKIYQREQLLLLSEEELMDILRESWGYKESEPIEVIGVITTITTKTKLYFLDQIMHAKTGAPLYYPITTRDLKERMSAFINPRDAEKILDNQAKGTHVKARLTLSPKNVRLQHNNPLKVSVLEKSATVLMAIPSKWDWEKYHDNRNFYVEQCIIEHYFEKNKQAILKDKIALEEEYQELKDEQIAKTEILQNEQKDLQKYIDSKSTELIGVKKALESNQKQYKKQIDVHKKLGQAIKEKKLELQIFKNIYQERVKDMESKLERLKQFIQGKSENLINLGLLDESEYRKLTGQQKRQEKKAGYDFEEVLDSDFRKAAAYIQAYMKQKSIYYHRGVIEDFFALLRTNDLIILAGDSGSGKTNLVKSFAEAIGGKSFIIPVKPNWTSAEDLLGYYNPLEKKYVITSFLTAIIEAESDPETPYFICLDEMNLARVEYYFADFLSLLEERNQQPEIFLYSDDEASHALEEYKTFLRLIDKVKVDHKEKELNDFVDILQDEQMNIELHKLCGFHEGDSLLNYHSKLRRILSGFINTPSSIKLPPNVRIIGAINVDETTHYLSPKILDRAHVMKFGNPFLIDLEIIKSEVESFDELDLSKPLNLKVEHLGIRKQYPELDENDPLYKTLRGLGKDYLSKLGVEFGFRTVRQAKNYANELSLFSPKPQVILNNFILHKVLPKLMLDGEQRTGDGKQKKDVLEEMKLFILENLNGLNDEDCVNNSLREIEELILRSEANDWQVNYWVK